MKEHACGGLPAKEDTKMEDMDIPKELLEPDDKIRSREEWDAYSLLNDFRTHLYDYQLPEFYKMIDAVNELNGQICRDYYKIGYRKGFKDGYKSGKENTGHGT